MWSVVSRIASPSTRRLSRGYVSQPTRRAQAPTATAATTSIQRIATVGGLLPAASACNAETVGIVEEVPYTADYYFWKATGD